MHMRTRANFNGKSNASVATLKAFRAYFPISRIHLRFAHKYAFRAYLWVLRTLMRFTHMSAFLPEKRLVSVYWSANLTC